MKTCYVSMPFGKKSDPWTGRTIDFDGIYNALIKPAVEQAGLRCLRADELTGSLMYRETYLAILGSDVMIADLTISNPNVLYELGIRHTGRRGITIMMTGDGRPLAFDIAWVRAVPYDVEAVVQNPEELSAARERLTGALSLALEGTSGLSPLYELFPELSVAIPKDAVAFSEAGSRQYPDELRRRIAETRDLPGPKAVAQLQEIATVSRDTPNIDPAVYVDVIRELHARGGWEELVAFADSLDPDLRRDPQIRESLALALNRIGGEKRKRAIQLIESVIEETGGSAEDFGILGRVSEDLYSQSGDIRYFRKAIDAYFMGFEKEPDNFYVGLNAAKLLSRGEEAGDAERLRRLLPRIKVALARAADKGPEDFWTLAARLDLSVMYGDHDDAKGLVEKMLALGPESWMLETVENQLRTYARSPHVPEKEGLDSLAAMLETSGARSRRA